MGTSRIFKRRPNRASRLAAAALTAAALSSVCAMLVGESGPGAFAQAATQPSWSAVTAFPSYVTSLTGATVAAGPTGTTLVGANIPIEGSDAIAGLWSLTSSGGLGDRLSDYDGTTSQDVQFLPNGDSIDSVWDSNDDETIFDYRTAAGSFEAQLIVPGVVNTFAANDDELLVIQTSEEGATATSYAIGSGGSSFTQSGSPVQIFSDPVDQIWAALDTSGEADVVVNSYTPDYSSNYLAEISRTASGGWGQPSQVSLPADADLGFMRAAVAPGGRMLVTMEELDSASDGDGIYALVREPGGSLGTPQTLLGLGEPPSGGTAAVTNWLAAAGPDGTLAVTAAGETCAAQNTSTSMVSSTTVWIAPAGKGFTPVSVPGSVLTSSSETTVGALAAGDGEAVVGLSIGVVTNSTSTGGGPAWNDAACVRQSGQATTVKTSDSAVVLGSGVDSASSAFGSASVTAGTGDTTPPPSVTGAAIDPNGYATVLGYLDGSNTPDYATFGDVGSAATVTTPTTTSTTTTTSSGNGSGSVGGGGQSSTSAQTTATPTAPLTQTPAAVTRVVDPLIVIQAKQTVELTNSGGVPENVAIFEWMVYSGLQGSQRGRAPLSKTRLVKIVSKRVTVKPHHKLAVALHLSNAAQKLLKKQHHLKVELQIVTSASGHRSTTVTKHLTLRRG